MDDLEDTSRRDVPTLDVFWTTSLVLLLFATVEVTSGFLIFLSVAGFLLVSVDLPEALVVVILGVFAVDVLFLVVVLSVFSKSRLVGLSIRYCGV